MTAEDGIDRYRTANLADPVAHESDKTAPFQSQMMENSDVPASFQLEYDQQLSITPGNLYDTLSHALSYNDLALIDGLATWLNESGNESIVDNVTNEQLARYLINIKSKVIVDPTNLPRVDIGNLKDVLRLLFDKINPPKNVPEIAQAFEKALSDPNLIPPESMGVQIAEAFLKKLKTGDTSNPLEVTMQVSSDSEKQQAFYRAIANIKYIFEGKYIGQGLPICEISFAGSQTDTGMNFVISFTYPKDQGVAKAFVEPVPSVVIAEEQTARIESQENEAKTVSRILELWENHNGLENMRSVVNSLGNNPEYAEKTITNVFDQLNQLIIEIKNLQLADSISEPDITAVFNKLKIPKALREKVEQAAMHELRGEIKSADNIGGGVKGMLRGKEERTAVRTVDVITRFYSDNKLDDLPKTKLEYWSDLAQDYLNGTTDIERLKNANIPQELIDEIDRIKKRSA